MNARTLIISVMIATSGTGWTEVLDGSVKLRLNFDAAPVNNVVLDTNPNAEKHDGINGGADGVNTPATWIASEDGRQGVMSFDGEQPNQITVDAAPAFNAAQGTITFWMKSSQVTQTPNPYAIVFDRRSAGGDVLFQTPGGNLANQAQQASGGGANSQTTGANVTDGKWHHIACVYDQAPAGSAALYVDGVVDASGPNTLSWSWVADLVLQIGKSNNSWWAAFTGFLDDFRFYDRMLTSSEVAEVAGLGSQPQVVIGPAGQPKNLAVGNKDTPSFTVTATVVNGDPTKLTYQWQKDSVDIAGATAAKYTFTVSSAEDQKKFRCVVSYPGASNVTSAEATWSSKRPART
jgi:hypothetical protein